MAKREKVLLVDDDAAMGKVLAALLAQEGMDPQHVPRAAEALAALDLAPFDLVITDLRMPGMDGMTLLGELTRRRPELPVIMLTAHGTVPLAVEALKAGAADFVLKPFDREELIYAVRKALTATKRAGDTTPPQAPSSGDLLGESRAMRDVLATVRRAAPGTATVLLLGESGTGKELIAREIHRLSPRSAGPLVKLNCGSLPDSLLESELFGYEKGAFTGAATRKPGRVELAQGGTLFLDEIGDVTPMLQVKLLRVLQEREVERLGGTQSIKVDVRFVAATHRNLPDLVAKGQFREDLYYRLNVVPIRVPPLRVRPEDVGLLARHFTDVHARANGKAMQLDDAAVERLQREPWPGNVRQLQNFIERLVVLSDGPNIGAADVERELSPQSPVAAAVAPGAQNTTPGSLDVARKESEREAIRSALAKAGGNRTVAARILGLSRRGLYYKLEELGLT
ncbi:MAG TPA: sigma-54 dependent transcriptional regulator [Polyangiaceae bacterium]|nr:sigma-54 dependent transcriptional regulator [Polyangiaceae bacterium]